MMCTLGIFIKPRKNNHFKIKKIIFVFFLFLFNIVLVVERMTTTATSSSG